MFRNRAFVRNLANTSKKATTMAVPTVAKPLAFQSDEYLKRLTTKELLGYGIIGMATLTSWTLKAVIKLFPYTPMFVIKSLIYQTYCGGDNVKDILTTGQRLSKRGINGMMISYTVEACDGNAISVPIDTIIDETIKSITDGLSVHVSNLIQNTKGNINDIPPSYVALKPTGLVENAAEVLLNYNKPEYKEKYNELVANCERICQVCEVENAKLKKLIPNRLAPFVSIVVDAERNDLQQGVYQLQRDLFAKFNKTEINVIGTVQMYLKESTGVLKYDDKLAREGGYKLGWKLVRGAYIHSEPDRGVIHDTKADTDVCYDNGISSTIANMASLEPSVGHLVVASHNGDTQLKATKILQSLPQQSVKSNVVLGQLMGMADNVTFELIQSYGVKNIIKYVPWGPPLETKQYLLRRLEENGDAVRADSGWPLLRGVLAVLGKRMVGFN